MKTHVSDFLFFKHSYERYITKDRDEKRKNTRSKR